MVYILCTKHPLDHELIDHVVPDTDREQAKDQGRPGVGLVRSRLDNGEPVVISCPDTAATKAFMKLADNCHNFLNPEEVKAG